MTGLKWTLALGACAWLIAVAHDPAAAQTPGVCPKGFTKQVDKIANEDRCYQRVDVKCAASTPVSIDAAGYTDRCAVVAAAGGAAASASAMPPACPENFDKLVKEGLDVCEYSKPPTCPAGRKLQVQAGPDVCR